MSSISERQNLIYGDGNLARATLSFHSQEEKRMVTIPVQFNPGEYSISRGLKFKNNAGHGEESTPENTQAAESNLANLKVSLILDTSTYMAEYQRPKGLDRYLNDDEELTKICKSISMLMKINPEQHEQTLITFAWGSMEFYGHMTSLNISYQMFNRNGMPVRAKLDVDLEGEEKSILSAIDANPKESPDRTKYRRLNQREELWMLADAEYNDASYWKEIARENGILNPRKLDHTKRLKVPAL
ncbi:MAG: hypothetical protein KH452_11890 [Clostridiales bacterium]|nr:hypothetical protein [Clostridiales bacterium]